MRAYKLGILVAATALTIVACASAPRYTDKPYTRYDKNTEYVISDESDGFTVFVYYSVHQYYPNENAVQQVARQNVMAIAYEYADRNKKEIQPINEQRIKISSARNGLLGRTTASASLRIFYK